MDFDRPYFLLLILPAVWGIVLGWRNSLTRWTTRQAVVCLVVRILLATLVCLAVAGPRWMTETREAAVVFLRDDSASIAPEAARAAREEVAHRRVDRENDSAEVVFSGSVQRVHPFGEPSRADQIPDETRGEATDLASALEYAAAVLPADRPGRIVVLSLSLIHI